MFLTFSHCERSKVENSRSRLLLFRLHKCWRPTARNRPHTVAWREVQRQERPPPPSGREQQGGGGSSSAFWSMKMV